MVSCRAAWSLGWGATRQTLLPARGEGRNISTANNDLAGRSKRAGHVFR